MLKTNKLLKKLDLFLFENEDNFKHNYEIRTAEFAEALSKSIYPIRWKIFKNRYEHATKNGSLIKCFYKLKQLSNLGYIEEKNNIQDSRIINFIIITKKGYERLQEMEDMKFKDLQKLFWTSLGALVGVIISACVPFLISLF